MLADLLLAILHHLLIFALAAVLVAEIVLIRPEMSASDVLRVGRLDIAYGAVAGSILIIGFARVFFGLKGADYYFANAFFWAKLAAFLLVGILSAWPTVTILRWRNQAKRAPDYIPPEVDIENARKFMRLEAAAFILIPVFAAMMARGYGI